MGETIAYPRQVTPVVVQHTAGVDQDQIIDSKCCVPTSSVWSGRGGCGRYVNAGSTFHDLGTNLRKARGYHNLTGQRL